MGSDTNATAFFGLLLADLVVLHDFNAVQSLVVGMNQIIGQKVNASLHAFSRRNQDDLLSIAETDYHDLNMIFEAQRRMQSVFSINACADSDDHVFVWLPLYEQNYVDIIRVHPLDDNLRRIEHFAFLLHWLYTKHRSMGSDGLITDSNSLYLLRSIFHSIQSHSELNQAKTRWFWRQFVCPSIAAQSHLESLDIGPLIDDYLQTVGGSNGCGVDRDFISELDALCTVFASHWRPLQRHFYWIFKAESVGFELKEKAFSQWLRFGARRISKSEDPPNAVLFDEFVFGSVLNRNATVGMTRIYKMKDYLITAVIKSHHDIEKEARNHVMTRNSSTFKDKLVVDRYYSLDTIRRALQFALEFRAYHCCEEMVSVFKKFGIRNTAFTQQLDGNLPRELNGRSRRSRVKVTLLECTL